MDQDEFKRRRYQQLVEGGFTLWVYRSFHDGCPACHYELDGLCLPPDHPFWGVWYPYHGSDCTCYVSGARNLRGARRLGGDPDKCLPEWWVKIDPVTGQSI